MRARIRLVLDYAYDGNTYEEGEHHKYTAVEWLNALNERDAIIQWLDWKYKMEKFYLVDNTIFPNTPESEALRERLDRETRALLNDDTLCRTSTYNGVCVRAKEHKGEHSAAEQARGK